MSACNSVHVIFLFSLVLLIVNCSSDLQKKRKEQGNIFARKMSEGTILYNGAVPVVLEALSVLSVRTPSSRCTTHRHNYMVEGMNFIKTKPLGFHFL